jgi:hypothetical protein
MIAYVGFDLGVDTSVVTNSFAPKLHLRKPLERKLDVDAQQGRDTGSFTELSVVLDIRPCEDEGQNV